MFAMVDYVGEMTAKRSNKYGKCRPLQRGLISMARQYVGRLSIYFSCVAFKACLFFFFFFFFFLIAIFELLLFKYARAHFLLLDSLKPTRDSSFLMNFIVALSAGISTIF